MKRLVSFTIVVISVYLLSCGGAQSPPSRTSKPQNLLLITLDTTRPDHLGCYGYAKAYTPNLDDLASRGMRFTEAVTHVPLTRPSHSTLMTGMLPQHLGIWSNGPYRLEAKWVTLAESFRQAGYHTGGVIASYVLTRSFGLAQGFDYFDDHLQEFPGTDPEKRAEDVAAVANLWLGKEIHPPFFLWLHFYDPHFPFTPPEPYRSRFQNSLYDGEIAYMDDAIGKVVKKLKDLDWMNQTIIVAVGDHGEGLGEHQEPTHGYLIYDSTIRVPLLLSGPGIPEHSVITQQVTLSDIYPTVIEAYGIKNDSRTDGKSFWKHLSERKISSSSALLENRTIHYQFGWSTLSGVRTEDWKWIHAPIPELYDLRKDPGEKNNLTTSEPVRAAEMKKLWVRLRPKEENVQVSSLSPEEKEKLESLGYIGGGPEGGSIESGPDPKQYADLIEPIEQLIRARPDKKFDLMEALTSRILARDASNLYALRVKGELLVEEGKFAEAYELLTKLSNVSENHPETFAYLGMASEATGRIDEALRWYRKAIEPPSPYWPALESLARLSLQVPEKIHSSDLISQFKELEAQSFRERLSLARAFMILSVWDSARLWYQKALQANPHSDEALVGMAQMEQRLHRYPEALTLLQRINPPTAESEFVIGTILVNDSAADQACPHFVESIKKKPQNVNLLFGLGYHLSLCNQIELAITAYEGALKRQPRHPDSLYNLAQIEEKLGNLAAARDLYRRFVQVAPPRLEQQRRLAEQKLKKT